jgi:hypothetical protein
MSSPGVTLQSSVPCRPQTPWCDGWMRNAFASIVQARPCPIFGRPVHQWGSPLDYGPVLLLMPFGFHLTVDTLPSGCHSTERQLRPIPWLSPPFPAACPFRVCLIHSPRPARHYPRFWIWLPSSGSQRDFNHPDLSAVQRTLWVL